MATARSLVVAVIVALLVLGYLQLELTSSAQDDAKRAHNNAAELYAQLLAERELSRHMGDRIGECARSREAAAAARQKLSPTTARHLEVMGDRTRPLVVVELLGRMGNSFFQIANGWAHARKHGYSLAFTGQYDPQSWESFFEPLWGLYYPTITYPGDVYAEPNDLEFTEIPGDARVLRGYFQSLSYFAPFESEVRELFSFHPQLARWTEVEHPEVFSADPAHAVALHVRRTDYLVAGQEIHDVIRPVYFERAIALMRARDRRSVFFIFSDDNEWCAQQKMFAGMRIVVEPSGPRTLYLLSRFKRAIISNSSFSWWAMFLGNATEVIAPSRWYSHAVDNHIYVDKWTLVDPA